MNANELKYATLLVQASAVGDVIERRLAAIAVKVEPQLFLVLVEEATADAKRSAEAFNREQTSQALKTALVDHALVVGLQRAYLSLITELLKRAKS